VQVGSLVDGGGALHVEADTTLPNLTLAGGGILDYGAPPRKPGTATVSGMLSWQGGFLLGSLNLSSGARGAISGPVSQSGVFDNAGSVTVGDGGVWTMVAAARVMNRGLLMLSDTGTMDSNSSPGASIDNSGVLVKTGPGVSVLSVAVSSAGSIALQAGVLQITNLATVTVSDGVVDLGGGDIGGDGSGYLTLTGGTLGGVLTGSGTVGVFVRNDGWVEPTGAGLQFAAGYTQGDDGNLLLSSSTWPPATPPVVVNGLATLAGSVWLVK
jgi:hypothetical protein